MSMPGLTILKPDLDTAVKDIFRGAWSERDGEVVPEPEDLKLGNDAVKLNATDSTFTFLVRRFWWILRG